jgi:hypothetical protein
LKRSFRDSNDCLNDIREEKKEKKKKQQQKIETFKAWMAVS